MGEPSNKTKSVEWVKVLMPLIVVLVTWGLSNVVINKVETNTKAREERQQEEERTRSHDSVVVQAVVEVIKEEKPLSTEELSGLIGMIKDPALREITVKRVALTEEMPAVAEKNLGREVAISALETTEDLGREIETLEEQSVQVIHKRGDEASERTALRIQEILKSKGYICFISDMDVKSYAFLFEGLRLPLLLFQQEAEEFASKVNDLLAAEARMKFNLQSIEEIRLPSIPPREREAMGRIELAARVSPCSITIIL